MAYFSKCVKSTLKFGNTNMILSRPTWQTAHACASGRQVVVPLFVSARAPEVCTLDGRVSGYQRNNSRLMSSLAQKEENDVNNPFSFVKEDMKSIYKEIMDMLQRNINNKEVMDIAASYYYGMGNKCGAITTGTILIIKMFKYHVIKDGSLTDAQRKIAAIVDLIFCIFVLQDDILDNTKSRRGMPTAHILYDTHKVIATKNMLLATCLGEAAKLGDNVNVAVCQMHEITQKGQFMSVMDVPDGDVVDNCLTSHDYKSASPVRHLCIAAARAAGANDSLVEIASRFGYNIGMTAGLIDDIRDVERDLRNRVGVLPVSFATREHPALKEMMLRKFEKEGDVEKALELVKNSKGIEKTRNLAKRYHQHTIRYLRLLADSPYRAAMEMLCQLNLARIDDSGHEDSDFDL